jgi:riboflavin kinase/FMN adenylyltransferase
VEFPVQFSALDEAAVLPARALHLAIGMFDGVHLGHRAVIAAAVQSAQASGGISAVLTFHPHPSALFNPARPTRLIMDPPAKAALLQLLGVDAVITQPFTPEFAGIEAGDFVPVLKRALPGLVEIYVGEDWRFGAGRRGDLPLLVSEARRLGVSVYSAPPVSLDGEPVSSTRIRGLLESGEISLANTLLGARYRAQGRVEGGRGVGRTIAFPTLNLPWSPELKPRFGVYAVRVTGPLEPGALGEPVAGPVPGVANYGVRPTVETAARPLLEIHLLGPCGLGPTGVDPCSIDRCGVGPGGVDPCSGDRCGVGPGGVDPCSGDPCGVGPCGVDPCSGDPCGVGPCGVDACGLGRGDEVAVDWLQFLRPEVKFPGLDDLRAQIARDVEWARKYFGLSS